MLNIPSFTSTDRNVIFAVLDSNEKNKIRDLTDSIKELEDSKKMLEYIQADPKQAKKAGLFVTALSLSVIIIGIIGATICFIHATRFDLIIGLSILGATYLTSLVIAIINGYTWRIELIGEEAYAFPLTVPIYGIFGPAVKVYAGCYKKDYDHALNSFQHKYVQSKEIVEKIQGNDSENLVAVKDKLALLAQLAAIRV